MMEEQSKEPNLQSPLHPIQLQLKTMPSQPTKPSPPSIPTQITSIPSAGQPLISYKAKAATPTSTLISTIFLLSAPLTAKSSQQAQPIMEKASSANLPQEEPTSK